MLTAVSAFSSEAQRTSVNELAWLSGSWISDTGGTISEMHFTTPSAGLIMGTNRMVGNGQVLFAEFLKFEDANGAAVLNPNPLFLLASGQVGVSFPLKEMTATKVVFENTAHDFPKTVTYELKDRDTLINRVEGTKAGMPPVLETEFKRVK